jgi:serine/threonine protein kinase
MLGKQIPTRNICGERVTKKRDDLLDRSPEKFGDVDKSAVDAPSLVAGHIIAERYRVTELLGSGATGAVYRVEQTFLGKQFAVKVMNKLAVSDLLLRRFQNEARLTSNLDHPNLVRSVDFGLLDGNQPFMVMDFVDGPTLARVLKERGKVSIETARKIFIPVLFAVAYAHDEGIIHRDIKPSNIILAKPSEPSPESEFIPKVVDFGISKMIGADQSQALTRTGEIFGTPLYMSPEQCAGKNVDHRSDIYSIGCVIYECLTGTPPFMGQTALDVLMHHTSSPVPSMQEASLGDQFPPALEQIVQRMLRKDPDERYQNCLRAAEDLINMESGEVFDSSKLRTIASKKSQTVPRDTERKRKFLKDLLVFMAFALVLSAIVGGGVGYWYFHRAGEVENKPIKQPEDFGGTVIGHIDGDVPASGYFSKLSKDGKTITFNFPTRINLGKFILWESPTQRRSTEVRALNQLTLPADCRRMFEPTVPMIVAYPVYCSYFRPGDYSALMLHQDNTNMFGSADDSDLDQIVHDLLLPNLNILNLENLPPSENILRSIAGLKELHWFADRNSLTPEQVSQLPNLRQLKALRLCELAKFDLKPLLRKLADMPRLRRLSLDSMKLKVSDIKFISKALAVTELNLGRNFVGLTDKEQAEVLEEVAKMPALKTLVIDAEALGLNKKGPYSDAMKRQLAKLDRLDTIGIDTDFAKNYSNPKVAVLQALIGKHCKVGNVSAEDYFNTNCDPTVGNPSKDDMW